MKKSDKIFVTGGTGFIGSYILRELILQDFQNIHAIHRETSNMMLVKPFLNKITWYQADLLDIDEIYELVIGSQCVIHAAGLVSFASGDRDKLYEVNVQGTENLVNACLKQGVPRMIHISSIAALAKSKGNTPITEETKWHEDKHTSHYGRSKHLGEMEVWRGMAEGLEAIVLNPSIVLGAGDWSGSSCRLFMQIHQGLKFYTPGSTGFVDVRDVARICVLMIHSNIVNERFILSESNYNFKQIFTWMAHGMDVPPPYILSPKWLAKIIVAIERVKSVMTGSTPVITADSVRNAYENFQYDHQKIKSLGHTFLPVKRTIQETTDVLQKVSEIGFPPLLLPPVSALKSNRNK